MILSQQFSILQLTYFSNKSFWVKRSTQIQWLNLNILYFKSNDLFKFIDSFWKKWICSQAIGQYILTLFELIVFAVKQSANILWLSFNKRHTRSIRFFSIIDSNRINMCLGAYRQINFADPFRINHICSQAVAKINWHRPKWTDTD